jgi:hypothetical protein
VYIAVLGTSLIVSLLALAAIMGQRIENRQLDDSADVRQAELNAGAAIELALLTMKQNENWRTTQPNGRWFTNRSTGAGTCSLDVTDPIDSNLTNNTDQPVLISGIGYSGRAEQRIEVLVDPKKEPLSSLRSAIAAGDAIDLSADTLRTGGLITANQISASASQVYGSVEAVSISGSTYSGTTTQINAAKRPAMPDWSSVFSYYRSNGSELAFGSLPASTPNLGRNVGIETGTTHWTGAPPGAPTSQIEQASEAHSGTYGLRVRNRTAWYAGGAQRIDHFVKPGQQYTIDGWLQSDDDSNTYRIVLVTKGIGGFVQFTVGPDTSCSRDVWTRLSATLTAPSWSGELEYAYIEFIGSNPGATGDFYLDDLDIREATTGRFVYRKVLSPTVNTLYSGAPTNAQGLYWINCGGNRLVIERSRIVGTLLVLNPGPNSCIADGPINWSPAVAGYPALLVDADSASDANFSIKATNRALVEDTNETNFNPANVPYDFANALCSPADTAANDVYPSEIRGLVVIRNDLIYASNSLVRGQVIVGGDIANSSGVLEVAYQPDALLNPPPGFWAPSTYQRRPASTRKVVLP